MSMQDADRSDDFSNECFLCTLDPKHACHTSLLEGYIIEAHEIPMNGSKTPTIYMTTATTLIGIRLEDQYYRSFVKELNARCTANSKGQLKLRVYHLPASPVAIRYRGEPIPYYIGNSYTLAVLEPDTLLNITDLNQAEYCLRQYLLRRLSPSAPSPATIRGNLIHYCFKELLKEHDHSTAKMASHDESPQQVASAYQRLQAHLEEALQLHSIDMALANVSPTDLIQDTMPHLESLARWYETESNTLWDMPTPYVEDQDDEQGNQVRAETFLLAPEIGLKGRLDLFWQQGGRQRLLELKTGGATSNLPKKEHRWQVYGYHALLAVRRNSRMKKALATLLYSSTPGQAQAFGIPASIREIQRVNETRNMLILSRTTGTPPRPPGPSRCTKCAMLNQCLDVSLLLNWQPPETDQSTVPTTSTDTRSAFIDTIEDRTFFAKNYHLLHLEGLAGEQQQAQLWHTSTAERITRGTAITGLEPEGAAQPHRDGWEQAFRCNNTSELREGDEILLSNGDPIKGEVVTGTIISISSERVITWTRELITHPRLIDRYDNELVHVRTLQNLLRWLKADRHVRDLVAGKVHPRFLEKDVAPRTDFNREQNLAVERAMQMQDYLLIHGPPGTGKTSVIAEIVKRFCDTGQRVMLAAFTNQAVDNMLKRLTQEGYDEYVRLGHERSTHDAVKRRLLQHVVSEYASKERQQDLAGETASLVREILRTAPVIATTTATWSSDKYTFNSAPETGAEDVGLHFDVAIVDEAGQLTIPAILGALRFAKRFILVGDEQQLPPLVLSKEASEQGLSESLFYRLKQYDSDYVQRHPLSISACISLREQYRMNKWIAHFASTVFYERQLQAHPSVANRRLRFQTSATQLQMVKEDPSITKAIEPAFPLVFLNVEERWAGEDLSAPKTSTKEAQAVRAIVAALLLRGIAQSDIGIIAPYRAQVAHIRRNLFSDDLENGWQALPSDSPLSIDTVDRFQGGERPVIIISFATTEEPELDSPRREFLTNPNRLNVALTRAQCKLILVGSASALQPLPIFQRLLTYCESMQTLIPYQRLSTSTNPAFNA